MLLMAGVGRSETGAHIAFNLGGRQMVLGRAECWRSTALCPSCLEPRFTAKPGSCWCCDHAVRALAVLAWGD